MSVKPKYQLPQHVAEPERNVRAACSFSNSSSGSGSPVLPVAAHPRSVGSW
jgi:hypothetical protein